jgi:hypothetical protein
MMDGQLKAGKPPASTAWLSERLASHPKDTPRHHNLRACPLRRVRVPESWSSGALRFGTSPLHYSATRRFFEFTLLAAGGSRLFADVAPRIDGDTLTLPARRMGIGSCLARWSSSPGKAVARSSTFSATAHRWRVSRIRQVGGGVDLPRNLRARAALRQDRHLGEGRRGQRIEGGGFGKARGRRPDLDPGTVSETGEMPHFDQISRMAACGRISDSLKPGPAPSWRLQFGPTSK